LENGDQTLIGERGIKLSEGQRVRLSLARALYSDAEILLLDDPIAALDSKVSKSVFEKSILPLKGLKTILLISHQFNFLLKCDKVILLEGGEIKAFEQP
jgi:ABC-type multidrug transport system fused ATPase/permease subunit